MTDLARIKKLAGLRESEDPQYTLLEYPAYQGSQPFLSGGDIYQVTEMVNDALLKHERSMEKEGEPLYRKLEIVPGDVRTYGR